MSKPGQWIGMLLAMSVIIIFMYLIRVEPVLGFAFLLLGLILLFVGGVVGLSFSFLISLKKRVKQIKSIYPKLSIVGIIQKRKASQTTANMATVMVSAFGYILLSKYLSIDTQNEVLFACFGLISLLGIQKILFDFRVSSGYYGNNETEAREIIQFILQEADNIDFTDNGKLKKIMSDTDLEEFSKSIGSHLIPEHS